MSPLLLLGSVYALSYKSKHRLKILWWINLILMSNLGPGQIGWTEMWADLSYSATASQFNPWAALTHSHVIYSRKLMKRTHQWLCLHAFSTIISIHEEENWLKNQISSIIWAAHMHVMIIKKTFSLKISQYLRQFPKVCHHQPTTL